MVNLILACIAVGIFTAYNIILMCMYGVPQSLSHTYYYLIEHGHYGRWFTFMIWIVCLLLVVPWTIISNGICSWSIYFCFLPVITCAALLLSSYAGNARKSELLKILHLTGARVAAVTALLWICICCWQIMWVIPAWALICGALAHLTKTAKFGRDFWIEWVAFGPTFTAIIWEGILQII